MVIMGHNWMSNGHKNSFRVKYKKLNQIEHKCPILMSQKNYINYVCLIGWPMRVRDNTINYELVL